MEVENMKIKMIVPIMTITLAIFISLFIQGCFQDIIGPMVNDVFATLVTNKKVYGVGEEIEMTIVLQNKSDESLDLTFTSGQTYDFVIKKMPEDKEIWRWSEGMFFTEAIWTMVLDSTERKTFVVKWDQKDIDSKSVEPGTYKIEAFFTSNPEVFANSYRIRIEGNKQELKSETIGIGTQSGYHERSASVIKDNVEWEKIWNLHTSNLDQIPRIPAVDFKTEMVIAIFRGEFTTSGYATEITKITELSDKIVVTVTETDEKGGFMLDVLTYPFHIVKLKRSELPVEFVYK
jgi:hypothetical protein